MAMRANTQIGQSLRGNNFAIGRHFSFQGQELVISDVHGDSVIAKSEHAAQVFKVNDLMKHFQSRQLLFIDHSEPTVAPIALSQKQNAIIDFRLKVINLMSEVDPTRMTTESTWEEARTRWRKRGNDVSVFPPLSSVGRYVKRYKDSKKNKLALLDNFNGARGRNSDIPEETFQLMRQIIDEYMLTSEFMNATQAYAQFEKQYKLLKTTRKCPTYPVFVKEFHDIPVETVMFYQKGARASRIAHYNNECQFLTHYPLSRVEMDAVVLQIGLLDDQTLEYAGIVVLVVAIDVMTKMILGYAMHVGNGAERAELAVACLKDAVTIKLDRENWVAHGIMSTLATDGGPAFASNHVKAFCNLINVSDVITEAYKPMARPTVERFFRTLRAQLLEGVSGYLGTDRFAEKYTEDDNAEKAAIHTVSEFKQMFEDYISQQYHLNPHRKLNGCSPLDVWNKHVHSNPMLVTLPENLAQIEAFEGRVTERTLQHRHGIELEKRFYNSDELKKLFHRHIGKKVKVYFSHLNIQEITVVDEKNGLFVQVPITDKRVTKPMSTHEYKVLVEAPTKGIERATVQATDIIKHNKLIAKKRKALIAKTERERKKEAQEQKRNAGSVLKKEEQGISIDNASSELREYLERKVAHAQSSPEESEDMPANDNTANSNIDRGVGDEY
jgi:putative transposase